MDFTFTPEQDMLRDSLDRLLASKGSVERRPLAARGDRGPSADLWRDLNAMGLLALPFAEADGGLGGSVCDLVAIGELFGRHLLVEPYVGSALLGGGALALGGDAAQADLAAVIAGERIAALAHEERHGVGALAQMGTVLSDGADGLRLNGDKRLVLAGAEADVLIVSARTGDRLALVRVDPAAAGVSIGGHALIDGRRAATIRFANVAVAAADVLHADAAAALDRVLDQAIMALAAEAWGAMAALLTASSTYATTRKQFGVPIASFQVIAHRLADMKLACAKAQSLLLYTTALVEAGQGSGRDIALLKAQIGRLGRAVGEAAVQIHGGIGMTDELAVGQYLKRILTIEGMLGGTDYHLRRVGAA